PAAQEDHAERALQVALWMQARLAELFGGGLALRIGVNTGEVVVGRPREGSSFVTGDAVNVGGRLEQAAAAGDVLAGERTVALVGEAFEFEEPTTIEAKGKPEGISCRRLVRMVAPRRPRGGRGLTTAFVGRQRELARLEEALAESSGTRRPMLVTLVGEPGVGKTSLVREFRDRIPEGTRFRLGRCLSYGRSVTYSAFADVLRAELGLRQEDPPESCHGPTRRARDPRPDARARRRQRPRSARSGAQASAGLGPVHERTGGRRASGPRRRGPPLGGRTADRTPRRRPR